jgi:hypothetical protein
MSLAARNPVGWVMAEWCMNIARQSYLDQDSVIYWVGLGSAFRAGHHG